MTDPFDPTVPATAPVAPPPDEDSPPVWDPADAPLDGTDVPLTDAAEG